MAGEEDQTANELIRDAMIRHQVQLQRLTKQTQQDVVDMLDKTEAELRDLIRTKLSGLTDPAGVDVTRPGVARRLQALEDAVARLRQAAVGDSMDELTDRMKDLTEAEAGFTAGNILENLPVDVGLIIPSVELLRGLVELKPFEGKTLKDWADKLAADDIERIQDSIRIGMIRGLGSDDIARTIVGSASLAGEDGETEITRRGAQAIARTAINFFSNETKREVYLENSDLIKEELYVATLDARTTPLCASLDGERFPVGEGPRPPLHFNCRSTRVPVFDAGALGDRPLNPTAEKDLISEFADANDLGNLSAREDLPYGFKGQFDTFARKRTRELIGRAPSATTYSEFLKGQSTAFQEEVLGVAKAQLFRDGGLTLDKFVNRRGDELTLDQLSKKYADQFRRAGLDPSEFRAR